MPEIIFRNIWIDGDIIEFKIIIFSDSSQFSSNIYTSNLQLKKMQGKFFSFGKKEVANEILFHFKTEPALLDRFIEDLKSITNSVDNSAKLECIAYRT